MSADVRIEMRLTVEELAAIDKVRGTTPRGTWIKGLCRDAVRARREFGRSCSLRVVAEERS